MTFNIKRPYLNVMIQDIARQQWFDKRGKAKSDAFTFKHMMSNEAIDKEAIIFIITAVRKGIFSYTFYLTNSS